MIIFAISIQLYNNGGCYQKSSDYAIKIFFKTSIYYFVNTVNIFIFCLKNLGNNFKFGYSNDVVESILIQYSTYIFTFHFLVFLVWERNPRDMSNIRKNSLSPPCSVHVVEWQYKSLYKKLFLLPVIHFPLLFFQMEPCNFLGSLLCIFVGYSFLFLFFYVHQRKNMSTILFMPQCSAMSCQATRINVAC